SGFNVQIDADATLDLEGHDCTLGSHSGAGTIIYDPLPVFATLTTGGDNLSTTFSGIISGNIALVKVGTGTLTLSGANTYVGPTTVLEGTLEVTGSLSPSSPISVAAGALLTGTATVADATVNGTEGDDHFVIDTNRVMLNGVPVISVPWTNLTVNGMGGND